MTGGGSISLIGIDSLGDVRIEGTDAAASIIGSRGLADMPDWMMVQPHFADPSAQALDHAMLMSATNHAV